MKYLEKNIIFVSKPITHNFKDLENKKFNRFLVLGYAGKFNKQQRCYWWCKCDCGNISKVASALLINNSVKSCGCINKERLSKLNYVDLLNKKFNKLKVIERIGSINNSVIWKCLCDCGNYTKVSTNSLNSGNTKSCGCFHKEITSLLLSKNLIGLKFGKLTVIERLFINNLSKNVKWLCKCDCGNEKIILSNSLISGKSKSCGCRARGSQTHGTIYGIYDKDDNLVYVGQTVKYKLEYRLKGHLLNPSGQMIKWLKSINYEPKIKPLIKNVKIENLDWLEKMTILWFSRINKLLNIRI